MLLQARKLILFWAICAFSFLALTIYLRPYSTAIADFGDSTAYMNVASAIASWHFTGLQVLQFWGVSYVVALVALIGHLPFSVSLVLVSAASSVATSILAGRLWGWRVAALMTALNFDWIQRSFLGGSEPLFMCLLLGAFLATRTQRWWTAAIFASLATIVRPLGICALAAIGLLLLYRKEYRRFVYALFTGLTIGALYILPLHVYLGDSLATVHSYENSSRWLFGVPFYAILQGTFSHPPLTNLLLNYFWIVLVLGGVPLLCISPVCREYRLNYPVEFIFAALYAFAICCYNYPAWALGSFPRFSIPLIPLALTGWRKFMQARAGAYASILASKMEPALWTAGIIFPTLAACSAYGIRNLLR